MEYNIWFDVSGVIVLFLILLNFCLRYNFPIRQNKIFLYMILLGIISGTADCLTGLWNNNIEVSMQLFPISVHVCLQLIYFLSRNITAVFYLFYTIGTLEVTWKSRKTFIFVIFPVLIDIVLIAFTPVTKWAFYIDEMGYYHRGNYIFVLYAVAFYYMIFSTGAIIYYRKTIARGRLMALLSFIVISLITVVLQAIWPYIPMESFGIALCMLITFFSVQKPEEIFDGTTQFLSKNVLVSICTLKIKQKTPFMLAAFWIDDFAFLEKYYGIKVMEKFLAVSAASIKNCCKESFYRISEDKICLIVNGDDQNELKNRVDAVMTELSKTRHISDYMLKPPIYYSLFQYPRDVSNVEDLLSLVEIAALIGKNGEKQRVEVRELDIEGNKRRHYLDHITKKAVKSGMLSVVYQPIYSVKKKAFTSAEALLRMKDENGENIPPDEFIPAAEKNGTILGIGKFVQNKVCSFIKENQLSKYGIDYIEINLSTMECLQESFIEDIMYHIEHYDLDPQQINLEITETAVSELPKEVNGKIETLCSKGVSFSLDDYGTGYSNLSRMIQLPFRIVKIDKSLVAETFQSEPMKIILDHTIRMLKDLHKKVLVEGVETEEQADYLIQSGCDYIQGYYYSRPLSGVDFLKILEEQEKRQDK